MDPSTLPQMFALLLLPHYHIPPLPSEGPNPILLKHDLEYRQVRLPMPLNPLLAILLKALLIGVYLDQWGKPGEHILQLELLLLQLGGTLLVGQLEVLYLHLVRVF
jgi:hypothetical protein